MYLCICGCAVVWPGVEKVPVGELLKAKTEPLNGLLEDETLENGIMTEGTPLHDAAAEKLLKTTARSAPASVNEFLEACSWPSEVPVNEPAP